LGPRAYGNLGLMAHYVSRPSLENAPSARTGTSCRYFFFSEAGAIRPAERSLYAYAELGTFP